MLKFYNSLTQRKEIFQPLNPNHVQFYVCGPTVYDRAHIGNARPVVVFDVLFRLLTVLFPQVTYVRNITDVDDKINAAALKNQESIYDLTKRTSGFYQEDMASLGTLPPTVEPRATDHIPEMIALITKLIASHHAYANEGHVLFRVRHFEDYGKLSNRTPCEMLSGARVEIAPYKEDPLDFVLWKPSAPELPGWDSPWGRGRPGWHIECSAMAEKYCGMVFDIHGGGIDLIFPHHENEIAQSRAAFQQDALATTWLHNGHVTLSGSKMSKSLGNILTVRDLLDSYPGEAIRLALLSAHYHQPLDWTEGVLLQAKQSLDRFYGALRLAFPEESEGNESSLEEEGDERVLQALCDDLNTPKAFAVLHELASEVCKATEKSMQQRAARSLKASGALLGILQQSPQVWFQQAFSKDSELSPCAIEGYIEKRNAARAERDFKLSDQLRQELLDQNIILEDSAEGTTWRRK